MRLTNRTEQLTQAAAYITMALVIVVVSVIRFRIAAVPLERDEGEYAYIGQLLLQGLAPFKHGYSMKLPGTSLMYALFLFLTEHNSRGIHLGLMCMNAYTMYFLFSAFRRLFNIRVALAASTCYGFMALSPAFYGFAAHATQFIVFYCSLALFFLSSYIKSGKSIHLFLFTLMFGMAFIMKQQAMFFVLFGIVFLLLYIRQSKTTSYAKAIGLFTAGVALPYLSILLWMIATGQFQSFWLWTIQYATQYESEQHIVVSELWQNYSYIIFDYWYLWVVAAIGITLLSTNNYKGLQRYFALLYFAAALLALSAGLYFRPHYFIVVLPVIALFTGIIFDQLFTLLQKHVAITHYKLAVPVVVVLLVSTNLYANRHYYFTETPNEICAQVYSPANVFAIAPQIAAHVNQLTSDTGSVAVLGSEPEVYFYTGRTGATGYLYTYPLVEKQPFNLTMQIAMAKEIEDAKPQCIVYYNKFDEAWSPQQGSPNFIFSWADDYLEQNYRVVEYIGYSDYHGWQFFNPNEILKQSQQPEFIITVYRRYK